MSFLFEDDNIGKAKTAGKIFFSKSSTGSLVSICFFILIYSLIDDSENFKDSLGVKSLVGLFAWGISAVFNVKEVKNEQLAKMVSRATSFIFVLWEYLKRALGEEGAKELLKMAKSQIQDFSPTNILFFSKSLDKNKEEEEASKNSKSPPEENKSPFPKTDAVGDTQKISNERMNRDYADSFVPPPPELK